MLYASLSLLVTGCFKVIYKVQPLKPLWNWPKQGHVRCYHRIQLLADGTLGISFEKKQSKRCVFCLVFGQVESVHVGNNSRWVCRTLKSEKMWCSETVCLKCFGWSWQCLQLTSSFNLWRFVAAYFKGCYYIRYMHCVHVCWHIICSQTVYYIICMSMFLFQIRFYIYTRPILNRKLQHHNRKPFAKMNPLRIDHDWFLGSVEPNTGWFLFKSPFAMGMLDTIFSNLRTIRYNWDI